MAVENLQFNKYTTYEIILPYLGVGSAFSVVTADGLDVRGIVVHFPAEATEISGKLRPVFWPNYSPAEWALGVLS
jgi:hypothetical protein